MSEDKPAVPPQVTFEVIDPTNVETLHVDAVVTSGIYENVVNVTLGVTDHGIQKVNGPLPIRIVAKLRFSREFALRLHAGLGELLAAAESGAQPPKSALN